MLSRDKVYIKLLKKAPSQSHFHCKLYIVGSLDGLCKTNLLS